MSSDAIRHIRYKIQESPICRLDGWVGTETDFLSSCSRRNLEESDDGRVGTLAVLDADWSVTTKYGGFFDIININELSINSSYFWPPAHLPYGHRSTSHFGLKSLCCICLSSYLSS